MLVQQHQSGEWFATIRVSGRVLLGYGRTRKEASTYCLELAIDYLAKLTVN